MAKITSKIHEGCILISTLFKEPMRLETIRASGDSAWSLGLVGTQSERFRKVILTESELEDLTILDSVFTFKGDGRLLRLGLQAYLLGIAWEFDPYFGLSISRVDPLPHQLEAIYDYLLKLARVRFLLADDAGAGKTIMAGLLIRELQLRGLAERILIVCPANLAFQWQRELKEKFDEKFIVLKGGDIRDQFGVNQWLEQKKIITSLDLAKRTEILPGLNQVHWDLIIVDEAHRMSWSPPARKTARYALGELLRDTSDHILLLTATPHKGDPANFSLFLQLLDADAYADVRSIREAMRRSLENRARRLEDGLRRAQELVRLAPPSLPDPDEIEEMEEIERERLEEMLEAITLAGNAEQVREEINELRNLASQAQAVEGSSAEAKLSKLKDLLHQEGFFDRSDKRLLLFTEFKDTLNYLVDNLKAWGFKVGSIHGGMKPGSRNEPGSRIYSEQQFREGAIQVLVATEAAGEGINLQVCNIMFNYDIPWNPNRLEQRMGRIHRYGQRKDCLIFNFVATNTIEGRVLQRLLEKLQEIRNALDDDAVFNVVGEVLPSVHVERILRDYYAGRLGDADLEERLLENVDEEHFRSICQNALEGLASKTLNLEMLIERRARAQERRVVPETIARFIREAAEYVPLKLKTFENLPHTFEPMRTPVILQKYERESNWKLPSLAVRYPRCSTDRDTAEKNNLEWVTPGHPLFEAIRRHTFEQAVETFSQGACFYSLQHDEPSRIDFYRARVVDGLGNVVHERLFAVELGENSDPRLREPNLLGDFSPADPPLELPSIALSEEPSAWLHKNALEAFLEETREERLAEVERIADHVELSLTELLQRADEEIGRANDDKDKGIAGADGRLAQAENRHAELLARRERRRQELERQRSLSLQAVERMASVLVIPHPEREAPDVRHLRPNLETEAIAMQVVMSYEKDQGRQVYDVHEKNLGYDITSLDIISGELRLIEVKGLSQAKGTILLTPNERRVAEDRRDCYWLYVVTNCSTTPTMQEPIKDPARFPWHEVTKVAHYWLEVNAMTKPMMVREDQSPYGGCKE